MPFAEPIELLILDVDGVLTDGGIIRDDAGQQLKRFHVRDGAGLVMWRRLGKQVAIITGKESPVVAHRAEELGIELVYQNVANKREVFEELCEQINIRPSQVAYVGDDLPDLPVMRRVAQPIAVADAVEEVRAVARYVTKYPGGYGAVRDAIEYLCKEMGLWGLILEKYTN
jgi:3-deoxy-D-manno-octulosonate 8-phosphate phosphatase (KDO 8-P phosphatase)